MTRKEAIEVVAKALFHNIHDDWGVSLDTARHWAKHVVNALQGPEYTCPVCKTHDSQLYRVCNRPDCTDGRDPR